MATQKEPTIEDMLDDLREIMYPYRGEGEYTAEELYEQFMGTPYETATIGALQHKMKKLVGEGKWESAKRRHPIHGTPMLVYWKIADNRKV